MGKLTTEADDLVDLEHVQLPAYYPHHPELRTDRTATEERKVSFPIRQELGPEHEDQLHTATASNHSTILVQKPAEKKEAEGSEEKSKDAEVVVTLEAALKEHQAKKLQQTEEISDRDAEISDRNAEISTQIHDVPEDPEMEISKTLDEVVVASSKEEAIESRADVIQKELIQAASCDQAMFTEDEEEQLTEVQDVVKNLINEDIVQTDTRADLSSDDDDVDDGDLDETVEDDDDDNDHLKEDIEGDDARDVDIKDDNDELEDTMEDDNDDVDDDYTEDELDETKNELDQPEEYEDEDEQVLEHDDQSTPISKSHRDHVPAEEEDVVENPEDQLRNTEEQEIQSAVNEKERNAMDNVISEILGTSLGSSYEKPEVATPRKRLLSSPSGPPEKRQREDDGEKCARTTPTTYQYKKREDCARTTPRGAHRTPRKTSETVTEDEKKPVKPSGWRTKPLVRYRVKETVSESDDEPSSSDKLQEIQHENDAILSEVGAFELIDSPRNKQTDDNSMAMLESSSLELLQNDTSDEDIEKTFAEMVSRSRPTPAFNFPEIKPSVKPEAVKPEPLKDELLTPRGPPPVQRLVLGTKLSLDRLNLPSSSGNLYHSGEMTPRTSLTQHGVRIRLPQNPLVTAPLPAPRAYTMHSPAVVTTSGPRFPFHPPPLPQQQHQGQQAAAFTRRRRHYSETKVTMQMTSTMHSESTEPEPQYAGPGLVQCTSPSRYIDSSNHGDYFKTYHEANRQEMRMGEQDLIEEQQLAQQLQQHEEQFQQQQQQEFLLQQQQQQQEEQERLMQQQQQHLLQQRKLQRQQELKQQQERQIQMLRQQHEDELRMQQDLDEQEMEEQFMEDNVSSHSSQSPRNNLVEAPQQTQPGRLSHYDQNFVSPLLVRAPSRPKKKKPQPLPPNEKRKIVYTPLGNRELLVEEFIENKEVKANGETVITRKKKSHDDSDEEMLIDHSIDTLLSQTPPHTSSRMNSPPRPSQKPAVLVQVTQPSCLSTTSAPSTSQLADQAKVITVPMRQTDMPFGNLSIKIPPNLMITAKEKERGMPSGRPVPSLPSPRTFARNQWRPTAEPSFQPQRFISTQPRGQPGVQRAVPTSMFAAPQSFRQPAGRQKYPVVAPVKLQGKVVQTVKVSGQSALNHQLQKIMSTASGPMRFQLPPGVHLPIPAAENRVRLLAQQPSSCPGRPGSVPPMFGGSRTTPSGSPQKKDEATNGQVDGAVDSSSSDDETCNKASPQSKGSTKDSTSKQDLKDSKNSPDRLSDKETDCENKPVEGSGDQPSSKRTETDASSKTTCTQLLTTDTNTVIIGDPQQRTSKSRAASGKPQRLNFNNVSPQDVQEDMEMLMAPSNNPLRDIPDPQYMEEWKPKHDQGTYQRVRLVSRPWKTPEGTVNRPTLRMMLSAVMTYIMSKPGISLDGLDDKYERVLQPVPLLELIEMLINLGCVKMIQLKKSPEVTLFSKRQPVELADPEELPTHIPVFLPTVDCLIKFGQFEQQLKGPSNG